MNRRGFISLLAGAAGGVLVPWRGRVEPRIFVPPRTVDYSRYLTSPNTWYIKMDFSNRAGPPLTEESLGEMLAAISRSQLRTLALMPRHLIISPEIKHLIDTDPVVAEAARIALEGG